MITNKTRGFTLIEMLIVIAILGLLLAIFIPAFTEHKAREEVKAKFGTPTPITSDYSVSTEESRCNAKAELMKLTPRYDALTGCSVQVGDRFVPIEQVRFDANGNAQ